MILNGLKNVNTILIILFFNILFLNYYVLYNSDKNVIKKTNHSKSKRNAFAFKNNQGNQLEPVENKFKIHVLYVHYIDTKDQLTIENFKYFMYFAYLPCDPLVDFRIILNTNSLNIQIYRELVKILDLSLINQLRTCNNIVIEKRINKDGGDLCAYSEIMSIGNFNNKVNEYKYFFFINSSVRGPFLPVYWNRPWYEIFTNMFNYNQKVVAVGPYLSCDLHPHIQSFFIAVDVRGLSILNDTYRCPLKGENRGNWIKETEVNLGKEIFKSDYEIQGLIAGLKGRTNMKNLESCSNVNPTIYYPLGKEMVGLPEEYDENCSKVACHKKFIKSDHYATNIYELTWIKYGGSIKNVLSNYIKKYVPLYTKISYLNKDFFEFN